MMIDPAVLRRREFLATAGALAAASSAMSAAAKPRPRLGVTTSVTGKSTPDAAIRRVHELGFKTCQVGVALSPDSLIEPLREALHRYEVDATAAITLGEGKFVWDFYEGPNTIGIVPAATRAARIDALKRASDLAKKLNIEAVHTHCGFIPENPNDPAYSGVVAAIREVASYCRANGQTFMMETGQETPVTLLRVINDVGLDNLKVNLDTANLILYGKGEPVGALEVIGKYVHGLHAKDGRYPTDGKNLGQEVPIGEGFANLQQVIKGLRKLNYSGPITIEREISGAKQEADIRASKRLLEKWIDEAYGKEIGS